MADEIKKPRGNPQFQLNKKKKTEPTMADDKKEVNEKGEEVKETKTETTATGKETPPPPAPDTLPSDLFSDKMPGEEVLPLDGKVKEKSYASLPNDATTGDGTTTSESKTSGDGVTPPPTPAPIEPPKTPEEVASQAAQTADLMIRGYEKIHSLGRWLGKVDQGNLTSMHSKGKINLEQVLPLGKKTITVQDFFTEYNQGIDENIVVSQEFKDNIRPPLIRECIKRNLLMNDLMYIGVLVAEDVSTKVGMLVGLKKSANLVLEACKSMMDAQQEKKEKREKPPTQEEHPAPAEELVDWHESVDGEQK